MPLVVPEVNAARPAAHPKGIVANPNCSTIQMVVALKPLHDLARIKRVVVSTYQASSGKGAKGLDDLDAQMRRHRPAASRCPPRRPTSPSSRATCCRTTGRSGEDGYTEEEMKMVNETRKIMGDETIHVSPTCVRVPVRDRPSRGDQRRDRPADHRRSRPARRCGRPPAIVVLDDLARARCRCRWTSTGRDEVFVGRIRQDPTVPHGLNLWVVADNLRKGAATNAVQIAEELLASGAAN